MRLRPVTPLGDTGLGRISAVTTQLCPFVPATSLPMSAAAPTSAKPAPMALPALQVRVAS